MKAYTDLPEGYGKIYSVDLQKNKKMMIAVNAIAVVIAAVMVFVGSMFVSFDAMFSMDAGMGMYCLRFASLMVLTVLYMVLHELVHGAAMKICGTKKVRYGFTGAYAFAGSDDYYDKSAYIFIALAPVVLWGAVIALVNPFVPESWFWVVYFLQIMNISGAAGDFFVTVRFSLLPKDILVKDHGVGMEVYSAR